MNLAKTLSLLLAIIVTAGLISPTLPIPLAHASTPPPWTVSLDAFSSSTTDATIESSHLLANSFNIGAIINASNAYPVDNVKGWQLSITYDNTTVAPGTDPNGPKNGVQFGAQTGTGNPGWAQAVSAQNAFGISSLQDVDATHRKVLIALALIGKTPVNIAPTLSTNVQGNLLASVNFTLLHNTTSDLTFTLDPADLAFADNSTHPQMIANINPGPPVTETVSNNQNPSMTNSEVINDATGRAPSGSEAAGASFHDTSTVTGVAGLTPGGYVTYQFYTTGNCTGNFASQTVSLSGGVPVNSASTGSLQAGSYSYKAVYGGDSNYLASTSTCEPLSVKNAQQPNQTTGVSPALIAAIAFAVLAVLIFLLARTIRSRTDK